MRPWFFLPEYKNTSTPAHSLCCKIPRNGSVNGPDSLTHSYKKCILDKKMLISYTCQVIKLYCMRMISFWFFLLLFSLHVVCGVFLPVCEYGRVLGQARDRWNMDEISGTLISRKYQEPWYQENIRNPDISSLTKIMKKFSTMVIIGDHLSYTRFFFIFRVLKKETVKRFFTPMALINGLKPLRITM
jgi:hypothetical protein